MAHCIVETAEALLDQKFPVGTEGFVRLVDYLGGDARIVQAARVSYGAGTKSLREDAGLIDYLLRNDHTSPFEQVVITFHLKMPIFVARQWLRHRTARLNEISGRYSIMKDECYLPIDADIKMQSINNKQGRGDAELSADLQQAVQEELAQQQKSAFASYGRLLDKGIARELARINLPLATYTEMYWQIDLHNLFHFLRLRCDVHAQKEIRDFAFVMLDIARAVAPLATHSFENHCLYGIRLSKAEQSALVALLDGKEPELSGRELERFNAKIEAMKK